MGTGRGGDLLVCYATVNGDAQELARAFNEEEAVWRSFAEKRLYHWLLHSSSLVPDDLLDALDWAEAEPEQRPVRAIAQ